MTPAAALAKIRKICLALPDATEKEAWKAPTFRAHGRMFAMFVDGHHGDGRVAVWCDAPPDAQRVAVLDDPKNFFVPPYVGTKGWIGVRLDKGLDWKRVAAVLKHAYLGTARSFALIFFMAAAAPASPVSFNLNFDGRAVAGGGGGVTLEFGSPVKALPHGDKFTFVEFDLGTGRRLSEAEIAAAKGAFGNKINYSKVRIITGADMTTWGRLLTQDGASVTWGNTIYFPNYADGTSEYSLAGRSSLFVHEMTHVYQYQKDGSDYIPRSIWEQRKKTAYKYTLTPGKRFSEYGVEQQAAIVEHYFSKAMSPADMELAWLLLRAEGLFKGS